MGEIARCRGGAAMAKMRISKPAKGRPHRLRLHDDHSERRMVAPLRGTR